MGEPETYDQRTVFKAINGAAELYISYGFVQLRQRLLKKKWTAGSSKSGGLPVLHRLVPYKGAVALVREKKLIRGVAGAGKLKATLKLLKGK